MSESVLTVTETDRWDDGQRVHLIGTGAVAAGTYTTGGIALNLNGSQLVDTRPGFIPLPGIIANPIFALVTGVSGLLYEYLPATEKLKIRGTGNLTPVGTIVSTVTVNGGAAGAATVGMTVDANSFAFTKAAATARTSTTPVASVFTGTASTDAGLGEITSGTMPSVVTSDALNVYAIFKKNV